MVNSSEAFVPSSFLFFYTSSQDTNRDNPNGQRYFGHNSELLLAQHYVCACVDVMSYTLSTLDDVIEDCQVHCICITRVSLGIAVSIRINDAFFLPFLRTMAINSHGIKKKPLRAQ